MTRTFPFAPKRSAIAPMLAVLLAALTGCTTGRAPAFSVVSIAELERSPEAVVLGFTIEAENRGDDALPLRRAVYSLDLDGVRVFKGSRVANITAPRFGRQRLELPVVVPSSLIPPERFDSPGEMPYALRGSIEYQVPGRLAEFLFDINIRRPKSPLDVSGTLELPGLAEDHVNASWGARRPE